MCIVIGMFVLTILGVVQGEKFHHGEGFSISFFLGLVQLEVLVKVEEFRHLTKVRVGENAPHQKVKGQYFCDGLQIRDFKNLGKDKRNIEM